MRPGWDEAELFGQQPVGHKVDRGVLAVVEVGTTRLSWQSPKTGQFDLRFGLPLGLVLVSAQHGSRSSGLPPGTARRTAAASFTEPSGRGKR